MTHALRTTRAYLLAAAALTAGAVYVGTSRPAWHALPALCLAVVLLLYAAHAYAEHQALLTECEQARQAALVEEFTTAVPCSRLECSDCTLVTGPFIELYGACCAEAFTSRGVRHGLKCRANSTGSSTT